MSYSDFSKLENILRCVPRYGLYRPCKKYEREKIWEDEREFESNLAVRA
jgi:hypothetical protein